MFGINRASFLDFYWSVGELANQGPLFLATRGFRDGLIAQIIAKFGALESETEATAIEPSKKEQRGARLHSSAKLTSQPRKIPQRAHSATSASNSSGTATISSNPHYSEHRAIRSDVRNNNRGMKLYPWVPTQALLTSCIIKNSNSSRAPSSKIPVTLLRN